MGTVYAEITLKNAGDVTDITRGRIKEQEVRQTTVTALVDTGANMLVINEDVRQKLGLEIEAMRSVAMANNARQLCRLTEPVRIRWKDRETTCHAIVIPGTGDVLLGVIPLEDMDLIVNPVKQELAGAHGDEIVYLLKGLANVV